MKEKLGATNALYPLVTALVGATVDGKPDFATIAHVGIAHLKGITLGMGKIHLTNEGIKVNGTFTTSSARSWPTWQTTPTALPTPSP